MQLCKTLVSNGAHVGMPDNNGQSCYDLKTDDKKFILRLLSSITAEPSWIESKFCQSPTCDSGTKGAKQRFGKSQFDFYQCRALRIMQSLCRYVKS